MIVCAKIRWICNIVVCVTRPTQSRTQDTRDESRRDLLCDIVQIEISDRAEISWVVCGLRLTEHTACFHGARSQGKTIGNLQFLHQASASSVCYPYKWRAKKTAVSRQWSIECYPALCLGSSDLSLEPIRYQGLATSGGTRYSVYQDPCVRNRLYQVIIRFWYAIRIQ